MELIINLINYYSHDPMRLLGLIIWIVAWHGSYLLATFTHRGFQAHVEYVLANMGLVVFHCHYGHIEMIAMGLTFMVTSIKGSVTHYTHASTSRVQN